MKKIVLSFLVGILIAGLVSFTVVTNYEPNKATAEAQQVQGYYIFYNCRPVLEYDIMKVESISIAMSGTPENLINIAIRKAKDSYGADGIVFLNEDMDSFQIIKFK